MQWHHMILESFLHLSRANLTTSSQKQSKSVWNTINRLWFSSKSALPKHVSWTFDCFHKAQAKRYVETINMMWNNSANSCHESLCYCYRLFHSTASTTAAGQQGTFLPKELTKRKSHWIFVLPVDARIWHARYTTHRNHYTSLDMSWLPIPIVIITDKHVT